MPEFTAFFSFLTQANLCFFRCSYKGVFQKFSFSMSKLNMINFDKGNFSERRTEKDVSFSDAQCIMFHHLLDFTKIFDRLTPPPPPTHTQAQDAMHCYSTPPPPPHDSSPSEFCGGSVAWRRLKYSGKYP